MDSVFGMYGHFGVSQVILAINNRGLLLRCPIGRIRLIPQGSQADFHLFSFGTQVGVTMVYTYATDAYKPQSGEIGAIINLFKSGEMIQNISA